MKNGFRIIDSDIHVVEPGTLYQDYLEEPYRDRIPFVRKSDLTGVDTWVIDGQVFPMWNEWPEFTKAYSHLRDKKAKTPAQMRGYERGFDAATTLEAMDIEGVDVSAVFRTNGGIWVVGLDDLEPEYAAALCRAYNNWMADFCKTDPKRLKGIALLPLQAIDLAIEEARRVVNELGFVGVSVHTEPVNGRLLYDPEVEPLWDEIERLDTAVCLHGTSTAPGREDISRKFLRHPAPRTVTHALSFPTQIMGAMAGMIFSGVLDRHPGLRVAFLEANCAWLPWMLYRLDDQHAKYRETELSLKPSEFFMRQCLVSMEPDEEMATEIAGKYGADKLIISTDYPHPDSAFPHAMDEFFELDMPDEARRQILWDNCAKLYKIED